MNPFARVPLLIKLLSCYERETCMVRRTRIALLVIRIERRLYA